MIDTPIEQLQAEAAKVAALLRLMANEQRLLILCHLSSEGEMPVSALAERLGLSQSALSQHLARLRDESIVAFRREAQSLFYRMADEKAARLLALLAELYCPALPAKDR